MEQQQQQAFFCQSCRARLVLVRGDSDGGDKRPPDSWAALNASVFESGKTYESFIVLDDRRPGAAAGPQLPAAAGLGPPAGRSLEESFVVLPGAASVLRPGPAAAAAAQAAAVAAHAAGTQDPTPHPQQQQQQPGVQASPASAPPTSAGQTAGSGSAGGSSSSSARAAGGGLDAKLDALASLCELASSETGVDHPLCLDCAAQLREEVEAQVAELEGEIGAYSNALRQLGEEGAAALSEEEFAAELADLAAQTAAAQQQQAQAESALTAVQRELAAQQAIAADIAALEERYWHDLNEYQLSLQQHISERDGLLQRIDRAGQQLLLLKSTNVLNDTFRIWHDGPFGTISGFRLGRTPEVPVEWEEINAAWGQAVLLLATMATQCKLNFSAYRLLPMGSHPRVADKRGTYDLFGPVAKLWGGSYDKAMAGFLACLKEFGDFARARDIAEGQPSLFEFPFAIEGDKVGNYTVRLSLLSKDAKWTKALKLLLADLKVALQWMIQRDMSSAKAPQLPSLAQEGPTHNTAA